MYARHPISMISALSLGPMPELVQSEMGDRALQRIFHASGLTGDLLYSREGYIPQPALVLFFDAIAREAGKSWVLGPWVDAIQIGDYGLWGDWVLSAPTLREGLLRGSASIHLHGTNDTINLTTPGDGVAVFSYAFSAASTDGYGELAIGGAAAMVSYCRAYLGQDWRPDKINLNIPDLNRHDRDKLETYFGCRIGMSETTICLNFDEMHLDIPRTNRVAAVVTYEDIVRERCNTRPTTLAAQIRTMVHRNLSEGLTGIEGTARALDIGVRTLQQRLREEGESYRSILKSVRVERGKELLQQSKLTITDIAFELGYEHAPHFTRMFVEEVGMSPSRFAKLGAMAQR